MSFSCNARINRRAESADNIPSRIREAIRLAEEEKPGASVPVATVVAGDPVTFVVEGDDLVKSAEGWRLTRPFDWREPSGLENIVKLYESQRHEQQDSETTPKAPAVDRASTAVVSRPPMRTPPLTKPFAW